jgi:hypothetical protein
VSVRNLAVVIATSAVLLSAAAALAAKVAIVRPASTSPVTSETVLRIRGELLSAGIVVTEAEAAFTLLGALDPLASIEQVAGEQDADGVVALAGEDEPRAVVVYARNRRTGSAATRRLGFDAATARSPQTMAIRAVELLRSSFLELDMLAPPAVAGKTGGPGLLAWEPAGTSTAGHDQLAVEGGAVALFGFEGVGFRIAPVLRVDWALASRWLAQLAVAGAGTRPTVATEAGQASIAQTYALAGAAYRWPGRRWQPFLALSAGALYTEVEGRGSAADYRGQSARAWSLLLEGGAGAWLRLRDRLYLSAAIEVQVAEPYLGIRFLDTVIATTGLPNLVLALSAGAWL